MMNNYRKTLSILLVWLSVFSLTSFAQVKKVAILETVDKEENVPYAYKLMLRSNLAKAITNTPGFEGYDRTDMEQITGEQKFQRTGMVSDEQIKKVGEMTGAQYVLVAEAVKVDAQTMFITAKILNVETAKMEMTDNALMGMTPADIQHGCESLSNKLLGVTVSQSLLNSEAISNDHPQIINTVSSEQDQFQSQQDVTEADLASFPIKIFPDGSKGVVFYKERDKDHGLAVSLDVTTVKWENVDKIRECHDIMAVPNSEGEQRFTYTLGSKYTAAIVKELGVSGSPAVFWCLNHGNGWYLPSAGELWYMLTVANNNEGEFGILSIAIARAGGTPLAQPWYWSSTEEKGTEAVNVSVRGFMSGEKKTTPISVRAVRAF